MVVGLVGALLTAAYMTRCVYLTFFGEYRGHGHPHESPKAITGPLVVLAGLQRRRRARQRGADRRREVQGLRRASGRLPARSPRRLRLPARRALGRGRARRRSGSRSSSGSTARSCGLSRASRDRVRRGQGRPHVPRQQVLPGPPVHRRRSSPASRARSPAHVLGEHACHRRRRQRRRRGATALGRVMYRYVDQDIGRRRGERARAGDGPGRWPAPSPAVGSTCSATRCSCSLPSGVIALAIAIFG